VSAPFVERDRGRGLLGRVSGITIKPFVRDAGTWPCFSPSPCARQRRRIPARRIVFLR